MNQIDKDNFEKTSVAVSRLLEILSTLFEEFGMQGMYNLTNPSIDDLKKAISSMKELVIKLDNDILGSPETLESASALVRLQNLRQGLFFAESLVISVERLDPDACKKANKEIKSNGKTLGPNWN